jgi:hypothetical protein
VSTFRAKEDVFMMRKMIPALLFVALICTAAVAQETASPAEDAQKPQTVTVSAADEKLSAVAEQICDQTGARILLEKSADVKVSVSLADTPLEDAFTAICKPNKLVWRRIYIRADSPLLKKPESLAANLRLMAGLQFPELLIERGSTPESLMYTKERPIVDSIPLTLRKDMGMVALYLITNDEEAQKVKDKLETRVEKYRKLQEDAMKLLLEMTPEEREQAMAIGAQQMQKMDPKLVSDMARSAINNPEMMQRMSQVGMDMLFSMNTEDRRAIMRMQMQSQQYMTDEQKAILMEDAKAVMQEMGITPGQPPGQ